jgi:hypothetical protein
MKMASPVGSSERRGELLQDGAVRSAGVLHFDLQLPIWSSGDFQARRTHDNPDSPSSAGQTLGQALIAMPFLSEFHENGGSGEVRRVPSAVMESQETRRE